jgi:hypothetical protein
MPSIFSLEVERKYSLKKNSDISDYDYYTHLELIGKIDLDIFCPENTLYIIVSEYLKRRLENSGINSIEFIKIKCK